MASYIVAPCRTPIGRFLGGLSDVSAPQLAAATVAANLSRSGWPADRVDEVILGQVVTAGVGQAPARQAALAGGLPPSVAAVTINKVCGSGLKAVMLADQAIRAGDAQVVVAGGMESMSLAPFLLPRVRQGWKFGHQRALDGLLHDGLWCAHEDVVMGELAEQTATACSIDRAAQDEAALMSHRRAVAAIESGLFEREIVPVTAGKGRKSRTVSQDEGPRADSSLERLGGLPPAFDRQGTVTAGNASQLSDGAATMLVVAESVWEGLEAAADGPVVRIVAHAVSGVPPKELFLAPIPAVRMVADRAGWALDDVDLFEINEAFAAQLLACQRELGISLDRVNVRGGAVALGHPIGASGARVLVTLIHAMADAGAARGIATLCLGGGNAVALAVELVEA